MTRRVSTSPVGRDPLSTWRCRRSRCSNSKSNTPPPPTDEHAGSEHGSPAEKGASIHQVRAASAIERAPSVMAAEVRSRPAHAVGVTVFPLALRETSTLPRVALE